MHNRKTTSIFRKPAAVFAIVAVCISLSVTALAGTGVLQGFFRDITDFRGAVVGTSYEQATDEIDVNVNVNGNELTVLATFTNPDKFPYRETELLGIGEYQILDADGKVVKAGATDPSAPVENGQAAMDIGVNDMEAGSYKLIVTAFVSEKKADQSLTIHGIWECVFTK